MTDNCLQLMDTYDLLPQEREELSRLFATDHPLMKRGCDIVRIIKEEVDLGKVPVVGVLLYEAVLAELTTPEAVQTLFGEQVATFVNSLLKVGELYRNHPSVESDAFRRLLLSMAEDIRVVIVLICSQLYQIRNLSQYDEESRNRIAKEASFLYSPLAHRLGLYKVKSELEDLSLKQTNPAIYEDIVNKLHDTKQQRDAYIKAFIEPVQKRLEEAGFTFTMKGRTKSVYSIWNKMKKQNTVFENIYDIFAIRIILDTPLEKEKAACWQVYSIVTDMYQPNPKRLRDWLSIPKSNGYESLHTTVMGPEGKWVEVQIRTQRMDEIAEKGFAAHFKYKGVKGEALFDDWLANVRDLLQHPNVDGLEYMDDFKLDLYDKEVFVFTPSGELKQLPKGATLLDFAFMIHSGLGSKCIGGKVNGKNVPIRYQLSSGDQVEIMTASNQTVHKEWLEFVQTTKARTHIKRILKEQESANVELGKELFKRRLKNWKLEYDERVAAKLAKKIGCATIQIFYQRLAEDSIDFSKIKDLYVECSTDAKPDEVRTADGFEHISSSSTDPNKEDVLVIDDHLQGILYTLSKCCNPIYGDDIFGFVSVRGTIKIHKKDCPNAPQMLSRFGYRFIKARWAGKSGTQYNCTLHVTGTDDIGIVTNISSLIQKETNVSLRAMSVDSSDGLFRGTLTVTVSDTHVLEDVIKKIKAIRGVKSVER
ncbi:MAG: bifunctional (p)ppGpp synthetase/guanosine-3',5'-bis(diphosphate) 3'-pyrophosphohydrolase [Paludibacteraceae bacterium]|nr:bifunctional (p)ppGpp synthetase/guanosine-3',5'-bis(diphosphate) 3'-pyrophosphohydrolase [Paludibacteraceae bacterium]